MPGIFPLRGVVKNYEWGGYSFISQFCGIEYNQHIPVAEYWMGLHPQGSSEVFTGDQWIPLSEKVSSLPFLLKVLDVREMLSIQVHPGKKEAEEGFERENVLGIPQDSPSRNYRDRNHKPEMMVALSDFWLLHGFKPAEQMVDILTNVVELNELLPLFNEKGYEGLYHYIMEMPQTEVNRILAPLKRSTLKIASTNKFEEDHWAAKAFQLYSRGEDMDRGIFSIYLFNLVHLEKGEGIFQGAGVPHAYLEGQNMEIMANSDNVLRGGLTSKHIDTAELLKHVRCEPSFPKIISPANDKEFVYPAPVPDFLFKVVHLGDNDTYSFIAERDHIIFPEKGNVKITSEGSSFDLTAGHPALVITGSAVIIETKEGASVFFAS